MYLVRHGRAAAGWDDDPDPPLDDVGRSRPSGRRAAAPRRSSARSPVVSSPLRAAGRPPAPLAARWGSGRGGRAAWWRRSRRPRASRWGSGWRGSARRWRAGGADLGPRYVGLPRRGRGSTRRRRTGPTVVVSHFVAINARHRGRDSATTGIVLRVARQLLDHRRRGGRRRAARWSRAGTRPTRSSADGPGWRRERAERGARTTSPSACASASGAVAELPAMLRELGLRRVVLMTSAGRAAGEDGERVAPAGRAGAGVHLRRRRAPSARRTPSGRPTRPSRATASTGS